jgi:hypothetical protein
MVRLLVDRADTEADSKDNNGRTLLSRAAPYEGRIVCRQGDSGEFEREAVRLNRNSQHFGSERTVRNWE